MRLIQIAIANVNPTVGAVRSNVDRVLEMGHAAARDGATLVCFPEQVVGGYPTEDLVQWRAFVSAQRQELDRFARETRGLGAGFVLGVTVSVGGQLFNAAALVHRGRIIGFVPKEKLPTYSVFYERRTYSRGTPGMTGDADGVPLGDYLFELDFGVLALEVCEDAWSPDGPMRRRCYSGAEVVVNVSASPFRSGVTTTRREMLATRSADSQAVVVYVNRVGGQDGLVFDGGGYVFQNGRLLLDGPRFQEGLGSVVVDLDRTDRLRQENTTWRTDLENYQRERPPVPWIRVESPTTNRESLVAPIPEGGNFFLPAPGRIETCPREESLDELYEALALGVKDYFQKTGAFRRFGLALSGGRDSLLALLVAWRSVQLLHPEARGDALRRRVAETISCFYMPSRFSAAETRGVAHEICDSLGIELVTLSIDDAFTREEEATRAMLGESGEPSPITAQNIQARLRALRMWNWSNSAGALFLQTSDMSEKAVGYTTIGGDMEGGLSVIANVPKTVVVALLERLHTRFGFEAIARCLTTQPGPELAHAQEAEAELMPFPILDACLYLYAGEKLSLGEIEAQLPALFPDVAPETLHAHARRFVTLFGRSIYKWVQSPLTIHVASLDLDRERALQLPVVERNEWGGIDAAAASVPHKATIAKPPPGGTPATPRGGERSPTNGAARAAAAPPGSAREPARARDGGGTA